MLYRVEIDINFTDKTDAEALLDYIENLKTKAYKPKGTEKIDVFRKCRVHACTHDEANPTSCTGYIDIDFEKEKKQHKL